MQGSASLSILLGTGTGSFAAASNFGVGTNPDSVAMGDFNGDGYLDLAVANAGSGTVSVLLNTCGVPPTPTVTPIAVSCVGDCSGNRTVTIDELVEGVNILLGNATLDQCSAFDCNHNGHVTIDCVVTAVNNALSGGGG